MPQYKFVALLLFTATEIVVMNEKSYNQVNKNFELISRTY